MDSYRAQPAELGRVAVGNWSNRSTGPSLFFVLARREERDYISHMSSGYDQFCPIAKAAEIFATRWTPLILRELMSGIHSFNGVACGVPLISRAVLVARLRELEKHGIIERRARAEGGGHDYWLTPAGEDFRQVVDSLGRWGMTHTYDRIQPTDLDPALLMWGLCKQVDLDALPKRRISLRFEFSGVPATRTKFRIMWLVLVPSGVDVCVKDPGFPVDLTLRGEIREWVAVFLGHATWFDLIRTTLQMEGDREIARALPAWLRLNAAGWGDSESNAATSMSIPRRDATPLPASSNSHHALLADR